MRSKINPFEIGFHLTLNDHPVWVWTDGSASDLKTLIVAMQDIPSSLRISLLI